MPRSEPTPATIVASVIQGWDDGQSDDDIIQSLNEAGVRPEYCAEVIDLVRNGMTRAGLIRRGLFPDQFISGWDEHPVFKAALKTFLMQEFEEEEEPLVEQSPAAAPDDLEYRRKMIYQLGDSDDPSALKTLVDALQHDDLYMKVYALQSLSRQKSAAAVTPIGQLLSSSQEEIIHSNAIKALAAIRDAAAVPLLIQATRQTHAFTRHDAAWALGEFDQTPEIIAALENLMDDHIVPESRDQLGLITSTSAFSVAGQAHRSLEKLRSKSFAALKRSVPLRAAVSATLGSGLVGAALCGLFDASSVYRFTLTAGSLLILYAVSLSRKSKS